MLLLLAYCLLSLLGGGVDITNAGSRSWRRAGQPGPLTRLLSCTPEGLQGYRATDSVNTVLVPSYRYNIAIEDNYGLYNRPGALLHWLQACKVFPAGLRDDLLGICLSRLLFQPAPGPHIIHFVSWADGKAEGAVRAYPGRGYAVSQGADARFAPRRARRVLLHYYPTWLTDCLHFSAFACLTCPAQAFAALARERTLLRQLHKTWRTLDECEGLHAKTCSSSAAKMSLWCQATQQPIVGLNIGWRRAPNL